MTLSPWVLTGNAGTNPATEFIGTSDDQSLVVKTNGAQRVLVDTNGNIELTANLGIGTETPRSRLEVADAAPGAMGPIVTITNSAPESAGQTVGIDLNSFPPPATAQTVGTLGPDGKPSRTIFYNPASRIEATSPGNYETDIVFLSNNPGAANNGLSERMRVTPAGTTVRGTLSAMPLYPPGTVPLDFGTAGVAFPQPTVGIGIGTTSPRSAFEAEVSASGNLGPVMTLTNTAGSKNAAAAIDFNTFNPIATGTYNPSSRIEAIDDGNFANDIVFLSNKPGEANNGLVERMRVSPAGIGIGTGSPIAPLHVALPAPNNPNVPVVLIEANSTTNTTPRLGLVDTSEGTNEAAPVWFIDNNQDSFRIFRQSNYSTFGTTYLSINNAGLITVPGDIVLTGADCAEHFDVAGSTIPEPGTVLVIDEEGGLRESREPYDKKVAGVVSGAGEYKRGILLDGRPSDEARVALALTGKVYCKVDAQYSPIEVGDLLTTSPTPGYAMKATEAAKAFGSVIGKALRSLDGGQGLVPILVSLQ